MLRFKSCAQLHAISSAVPGHAPCCWAFGNHRCAVAVKLLSDGFFLCNPPPPRNYQPSYPCSFYGTPSPTPLSPPKPSCSPLWFTPPQLPSHPLAPSDPPSRRPKSATSGTRDSRGGSILSPLREEVRCRKSVCESVLLCRWAGSTQTCSRSIPARHCCILRVGTVLPFRICTSFVLRGSALRLLVGPRSAK